MKTWFATVAGILLAAGPALAQDAGKTAPAKPAEKADKPAAHTGGMPVVKPGPEHESLKQMVGTWDATVEMMAPGAPASKGVEVNKALADGLWVVTEFKSDMGGKPFEGHGVWGYDPAKKKYVGTWVDSMTSGLTISEGTYDAATKTATDIMESPGPDGKPMKIKATTVWKDSDTRVFTMYEGEKPSMKITYTRRK
jgi:hypothetical protein